MHHFNSTSQMPPYFWAGRNRFILFKSVLFFFFNRKLESSGTVLCTLVLTYGRWSGQTSQPVKMFTFLWLSSFAVRQYHNIVNRISKYKVKRFLKNSHSTILSGQAPNLHCKLLDLNPWNTWKQANSSYPLHEIPIVLEDLSGSRRYMTLLF